MALVYNKGQTMTKSLSALSYFNPVSKAHHCLDDFKSINAPKQKAVIIALTILTAIITLPIAGFGGVAVFRRLTEHYVKLAQKTAEVAQKTLPEPTKPQEPRRSLRLQQKREQEIERAKQPEQLPPAIKDNGTPKPTIAKPADIEEMSAVCKKSRKKGYIVSVIGSDRLKYWCPKATAVAGLVIGFYTSNLLQNYGIYFAVSQATTSAALSDVAAKLAPYVGKSSTVHVASTVGANTILSTEDTTLLAEIHTQLTRGIEQTQQNYKVLESVATNLGKAASASADASILSRDGARAAVQFAKTASHGDVPLNFLSPTNGIVAIATAGGGYILGQRLADWLDSE